jgi:hypothetical protein
MKITLSPARWLWRFVGLRRARYALGQHDLACKDLNDPGPTLHEAVHVLAAAWPNVPDEPQARSKT